jgi:hypothetical protein
MLIVAEPTGVGEKLSHIFSELNLFSSELFKNVVIQHLVYLNEIFINALKIYKLDEYML